MIHSAAHSSLLAEDTNALLRTRRFGRSLRGYSSVDSTNDVAAAWADDGAPEGSVVVTDVQTAGRGRRGRRWEANAGRNLMFSLVLRPSLSAVYLGRLPIVAALAVAGTLDAFAAPLTAEIKWPNDIRLDGRKCCGVLMESTVSGDRPSAVILGIGVNVNQDAFPPSLADSATSLLLATGRVQPRATLLAALLDRLERRYDSIASDWEHEIRPAYEARMAYLGDRVVLRHLGTDRSVSGIVRGIDAEGALRLDTADGSQTFHAGELTSQ